MKKIMRTGILAAVIVAAGYLTSINAQTVTGSIGNGTFTPGKPVRAVVVLSLPGGLHANSHSPGGEYSVPTTVRATASGVRIGAVSYPRGRDRKFEFSADTINVYEGPKDKFVWDVSHQVYVHKLLTGRKDRFHTIRTTDGLNGFALRTESEHDCYGAGAMGRQSNKCEEVKRSALLVQDLQSSSASI